MKHDKTAQSRIDAMTGVSGRRKSMPAEVRAAFEADACADVLTRAIPPRECGPAMPVAPARGPMMSFMPRKVVKTDAGNYVTRRDGHEGRYAARSADGFDLMERQARKVHQREMGRARSRGRPETAFVAPLTPGQVEIGRVYAQLTERCLASGVKCASLEALRQAASSGGDREVAIFRDFQRLRAFHARIGDGLAKDVRRIRPDGEKRTAIRVRTLVDQVCLGGLTIHQVLTDHGWGTKNDTPRKALLDALRAALDRMQGYDLARPQNMG